MQCFIKDDAHLTDNLGQPVPECLQSRCYWAKDDGAGEWWQLEL